MTIRPKEKDTAVSMVVKYGLFFSNFVFWILGGVIGGLGIWLVVMKEKVIRDFIDVALDPSLLMCIGGCLIFILAFFGWWGALRENICFLRMFHIVLIVLLLLEVVFGVLIILYFYVPSVRAQLDVVNPTGFLKNGITRYRDDPDLKDSIDAMQEHFECCGASETDEGYKDWDMNPYFNCTKSNPSAERCAVPFSCCKRTEGDILNIMCGFETLDKKMTEASKKIYTQGCVKGFSQWLESNALWMGGICLGIVIPQLIAISMARRLVDQVRVQKLKWRVHRRPDNSVPTVAYNDYY